MTVNAGMDVGKGKHSLLVGILHTLWKSVGRVFKRLKVGLPHDLVLLCLDDLSRDSICYNKDRQSSILVATLVTTARKMK